MMREVDAEADHHRVAGALEEDAGELGAMEEEVVGPFQPESVIRAGEEEAHRLLQRHRGDQRQRRRCGSPARTRTSVLA